MSQFIGDLGGKLVSSSKNAYASYKDPIKNAFKRDTGTDHSRLVNEDELGEENELRERHAQQMTDLQSDLYSYEESPTSKYRNKVLMIFDRCILCKCPKRWQVAILANLGFVVVFGLRINFGAAKNHMTKTYNDTQGVLHIPEFHWTPGEQSWMESAFFYGYLVTQVPGGFLASKFPPNRLFGVAILLACILNSLMPAACHAGPVWVGIVQICIGLVQGVSYPAVHGIWSTWAPPLERSKLATTAFTGSYAGAVVGMPLSATLVSLFHWSTPFYFYSVAGIVWAFFWFALVFERPCTHPTISREEKNYIESSLHESHKPVPLVLAHIPWKAILTSKPVWAIIVANFARSWTFYLLLINQLTYMREVYHVSVAASGFMAALPHALMAVVVLIGGQLADLLRSRNIMTTTNVRKLFNCGGFGGEALFLLVVAYAHSEAAANVGLILAVGSSGFAISGFNVNHLDIAPKYASLLMGMSNGVGTLSGIISPWVTEKLRPYGARGWETVFLLASLIHFTGVTFYAVFASGEQQEWAVPPDEQIPWKPDEFAQKAAPPSVAAQSGMLPGYGATNHDSIAPLPTTEDLMKHRQDKLNGFGQQQNTTESNTFFDPNAAWGDDQQNNSNNQYYSGGSYQS